jgi:hypothetical protein
MAIVSVQFGPVAHQIGSEVRDILRRKLRDIVAELNSALNLDLDNTPLDLTTEGNRLRIHFWLGTGSAIESEVSIFIDSNFAVEKRAT